MDRKPVASSNIAGIGYDTSTETLEVEFHDGGVYQYYGVPEYVYHEFIAAGSHGRYFFTHIRNRYSYARQ